MSLEMNFGRRSCWSFQRAKGARGKCFYPKCSGEDSSVFCCAQREAGSCKGALIVIGLGI